MKVLPNLFDSYSRQARLFPALLTIFSPLLTVLAWFPALLLTSLGSTLLTLATSCGLLYFMSSLARTRGKTTETRLLKEWGGWPTTHALRHRGRLDVHTRQRYHKFLAAHVPDLKIPTAVEAEPKKADAVYASAIKWLKERTRGGSFTLVEKENAQYGFRRNLRGMRSIGLALALAALAISLVAITASLPDLPRLATVENYKVLALIPSSVWAALTVDTLAILVFLFVVTDQWVLNGGEQYADAILTACDQLQIKSPASKMKKT